MRLIALVFALLACVRAYGKQPGELNLLQRAVQVGASQEAELVLAAGCFWGVELAFARIPGVLRTQVGYVGGSTSRPTYRDVSRGTTGHAEAVKITYSPDVVSTAELLGVFFDAHDPTTLNRQGNDVGTQYRSAIFYTTDSERSIAASAIEEEAQRLGKHVVTTLEKLSEFTPAEDYHRERDRLESNFPSRPILSIMCT